MKDRVSFIKLAGVGLLTALLAWIVAPQPGHAHCDTLDGPVVKDARTTLEKADVAGVLKWVRKDDEQQIRRAFGETLAVRRFGAQAKALADMYFVETLVRIHRAAEGAPYTGLKPAGQVEPVVAAADNAIKNGSVEDLSKEVSALVMAGIHQRFERLMQTKKLQDESVDSGREYVEAYVEFVHYVERLHDDALGTGGQHAVPEGASTPAEHVH